MSERNLHIIVANTTAIKTKYIIPQIATNFSIRVRQIQKLARTRSVKFNNTNKLGRSTNKHELKLKRKENRNIVFQSRIAKNGAAEDVMSSLCLPPKVASFVVKSKQTVLISVF